MPIDVYIDIHTLDSNYMYDIMNIFHIHTRGNATFHLGKSHLIMYISDISCARVYSMSGINVRYALLLPVIVNAVITTHVYMLFNLSRWIKPA